MVASQRARNASSSETGSFEGELSQGDEPVVPPRGPGSTLMADPLGAPAYRDFLAATLPQLGLGHLLVTETTTEGDSLDTMLGRDPLLSQAWGLALS